MHRMTYGVWTLWLSAAVAGFAYGTGRDAPFLAVAKLAGNSSVTGTIVFEDEPGSVTVRGVIYGLPPNGRFGLHVHEFGNITAGCQSAGDHWNPFNQTHGDVADASRPRHSGDLSNVQSDAEGVARFSIPSAELRLRGWRSVVGRTVVVHEKPDDLGLGGQPSSLMTGDSGGRVACGVIGIASCGVVSGRAPRRFAHCYN